MKIYPFADKRFVVERKKKKKKKKDRERERGEMEEGRYPWLPLKGHSLAHERKKRASLLLVHRGEIELSLQIQRRSSGPERGERERERGEGEKKRIK